MQYRPLFNNILVKPLKEKLTGIVVEDENYTRGEIVAVGLGEEDKCPHGNIATYPNVLVGEIVHFITRTAKPITLDNQDYFVLDQHDILVVEGK